MKPKQINPQLSRTYSATCGVKERNLDHFTDVKRALEDWERKQRAEKPWLFNDYTPHTWL